MATAALILATPGAAGAADSPAEYYSYRCATGWVESKADGLKIRTAPKNDADILRNVTKGSVWECAPKYYVTGDRYNGCGVYNASAWIYLWTSSGPGYSAMTCWLDVTGD
jgi:hypothetical protein